MKRLHVLGIFVGIVILIAIAGYSKFKNDYQKIVENKVSVVTPTTEYKEPIGSHANPIPSFSGETYRQTDEKYGISAQLPVEFKPIFKLDSLHSSFIAFKGMDISTFRSDENKYSSYNLTNFISFDLINKKDKNFSKKSLSDQELIDYPYPKIMNLPIGKSYTNKYGNGSTFIYTKVEKLNNWNIFKYLNDNETEPLYGYEAILEKDNFYYKITLSAYYPGESEKIREQAINYQKDLYYSILKSISFSK